MRVSLRWLGDFLELPTTDPGEIARALTGLGLKVESIEHLEARWAAVVTAKVVSAEPHPHADRLRVCRVDMGSEVLEVVCGAWNFEAGATVAFAPPGARLADGTVLEVRRIRGVESNGMICSERELGLSDDHEGILVLPDEIVPGRPLEEVVELPDVVFELEVTANRPDAMSMIGVARELAAYYRIPYRWPEDDYPAIPGAPTTKVEIADPAGCYRFTLREIRNVRVGPSPLWMRRRLQAAGVRPINNVVDVTNYVMIELGHPLHAFDADRLEGDLLVVRRAEDGETLVTLDGVTRRLSAEDVVICDRTGPVSLAGTMGGESTEVGDQTTRVLLEAASWDPPSIMWMSRRHGLRSEASARFERGVDPNLPPRASARAALLIHRLAGGDVLEGLIDEVAVPFAPRRVDLPLSEVERLLGPGFDQGRVVEVLTSLDLEVEGSDPLTVVVPTFRPDLSRPVDLVEEVARLVGYDSFPETLPRGPGGGWNRRQKARRRLVETLAGLGLNQALPLPFVTPEDLQVFDHPADDVIRVTNPLREEESILRPSLLPGLLKSLRRNVARGVSPVGLFEVGRVFIRESSPDDPRIPNQPERLGWALVGSFGPADLAGRSREVDVYTSTGILRVVVHALGGRVALQPDHRPGFHPGRTARVTDPEGQVLGWVGELHPLLVDRYELDGRVAIAELDLDRLLDLPRATTAQPVSALPAGGVRPGFHRSRGAAGFPARRLSGRRRIRPGRGRLRLRRVPGPGHRHPQLGDPPHLEGSRPDPGR
ncbi:MAG: phenylalanine--tRNA ligase beta subunit [Acidimicrobiia bacterium]|nr:MAG: phenylalanine--tRNA ligase beta subunit [Acidimicrobiia bacterium]